VLFRSRSSREGETQMKVLAEIGMSNIFGMPSPDDYCELLAGFADHLQAQNDSIDCFYGKSWDTGFAILDVDSVEQAWEVLMKNPMYPYWTVELTVLTDPVRVNHTYVHAVAARFVAADS